LTIIIEKILFKITADMIVKLFEENPDAIKRFAELLIIEPDIRLTLINAIIRDIATKEDLEKLENRIENRISMLENRINSLESRISVLEGKIDEISKRLVYVFKMIMVSLFSIIVSITITIIVKILP